MDSEDEYLPDDSDLDAEDLGKLENEDDGLPEDRTRPRGAGTARKRRTSRSRPPAAPPPLKRARGAFSMQYLHLLNEDIQDAAAGTVREAGVPLEHTQVGAVGWSAAEKAVFFAALGRLGRDDLAGIAARVRTKSEPEVRQYMMLLDDYDRDRRTDDVKRRRTLQPVDIPAAAEVGQACCAALEEAADGVALRQERYEEALEQRRWGGGRWLVTPALAQVLESQHRRGQDLGLPFAELFAVRNWLRLSDRVFMNSAVPDGNWRCVEEQAPSVRATAFADFHALALSVTRRLLLASLYVAESRIRAKNTGDPRHRTRPLVRPHDVRVAAASVGLKEDSRAFWARCARRLRIDVYDDDDNEQPLRGRMRAEKREDAIVSTDDDRSSNGAESYEDGDEDEDEERESMRGEENMEIDTDQDTEYDTMTYDAVEAALGLPQPGTPQDMTATLPDWSDDDTDYLSDALSAISSDADADADAAAVDEADPLLDPAAIERDLDEAISYSALPYSGTTRAKQALRARVRGEHLLEAEAEQVDAQTGAREEARLWALLRGEEEEGGAEEKDVKDTAPTDTEAGDEGDEEEEEYTEGDREESGLRGSKSSRKKKKPQSRRPAPLVELGPDWRDGLTYYSEWETPL
ncbi:hypothetical protein F4775DRAFT_558287 [Biscogniauxia sp. FL1348]|nr:hypothetical protein F4775DRAFT_558287 [Biscogniauxia sp. FL1348]